MHSNLSALPENIKIVFLCIVLTYEHQVLPNENALHLMIKSAYWGMSLRQQKYKS